MLKSLGVLCYGLVFFCVSGFVFSFQLLPEELTVVTEGVGIQAFGI